MTEDPRPKMREAIRATAATLSVQRGVPRSDALRVIGETYRENLMLSLETSMAPYWRLMVQIADEETSSELGNTAFDSRVTPIRGLPKDDQ